MWLYMPSNGVRRMREKKGAPPAEERALLDAVRSGSQEAFARLAARYDAMLSALAKQLVVPALEVDDLKQEGLLALLSAAKSFDEQAGVPFSGYVRLCVRHRMISARRRVMALPVPVEGDDEVEAQIPVSGQAEPEQMVVDKEEEQRLFARLRERLSPLEYAVMCDYLEGYSYEEIASRLNTTAKSVDNALARARRKLQTRL